MSPLRLGQVAGAASDLVLVGVLVDARGVPFQPRDPVAWESLVGVLDPVFDVDARHKVVGHQNRVADLHFPKRDVDGAVFSRLRGRNRKTFFDGKHVAFTPVWGGVKRIAREQHRSKGLGVEGAAPPPWNHLGTTCLVRWGRAGAQSWRRFALSAPTAPTYFLKRMATEYVLLDGCTAQGARGKRKPRGGGRWGHPSGKWLEPAPLLGWRRPHLGGGRNPISKPKLARFYDLGELVVFCGRRRVDGEMGK